MQNYEKFAKNLSLGVSKLIFSLGLLLSLYCMALIFLSDTYYVFIYTSKGIYKNVTRAIGYRIVYLL